MTGHRNVGGTPGWKAMRGTCPECKRDCALSPPVTGDSVFRIKAHGPIKARCKGVGRAIPREATRFPEK